MFIIEAMNTSTLYQWSRLHETIYFKAMEKSNTLEIFKKILSPASTLPLNSWEHPESLPKYRKEDVRLTTFQNNLEAPITSSTWEAKESFFWTE